MSGYVFTALVCGYSIGYMVVALSSWNAFCDDVGNDLTKFPDVALGICGASVDGMLWPIAALLRAGLRAEAWLRNRPTS